MDLPPGRSGSSVKKSGDRRGGSKNGGSACVVGMSTFPDAATAARIGRQLVEDAIVACANVLPGIRSIYFWNNEVQEGDEVLVFFKLPAANFAEFQKRLSALHPYDVPEIIQLKISAGLPSYLRWVAQNCASH